jgi:hypothetical protein
MNRYPVPEGTPERTCKGGGCLRPIFYIVTPSGARMPVDPDGTPHFATCPDSKQFKEKARLQARLVELREKGW